MGFLGSGCSKQHGTWDYLAKSPGRLEIVKYAFDLGVPPTVFGK